MTAHFSPGNLSASHEGTASSLLWCLWSVLIAVELTASRSIVQARNKEVGRIHSKILASHRHSCSRFVQRGLGKSSTGNRAAVAWPPPGSGATALATTRRTVAATVPRSTCRPGRSDEPGRGQSW